MYILKNVSNYISMTGGLHLVGNVYNHPIYGDETQIHTSRVVSYKYPTENSIICTTRSGSLYTFNKEDIIDETLNERLEVI